MDLLAVDNLTLEELQEKVDELQRVNENLGMENEMLADHMKRNNISGDANDEGSTSKGPRSRTGKAGKGAPSLSLEAKYKIASEEMDSLNDDIEQTKRTSEQNLDILKALMEETDIRTAEVKRDAYEFRRDIVVGAENPRSGKTIAEKVLKYYEDKLTQKDMLINKLLMKNQSYKLAIKKTDNMLKTKQKAGDDLQYIDFHQLQIENQQFVVKIEEANQDMLSLKRTAGQASKHLNSLKKRLSALAAEEAFLNDEIRERRNMLSKTEQDMTKVIAEKESARKDNKKLRVHSRVSPDIPQVVDYVNQKAEFAELVSAKSNWQRKVEIAEMAAVRAAPTAVKKLNKEVSKQGSPAAAAATAGNAPAGSKRA